MTELVEITKDNVQKLKLLNSSILPIHYSDKFYKHVLSNPHLCRLAVITHDSGTICELTDTRPTKRQNVGPPDKYVGMVCCRKEPDKLYIMTLGCLVLYRRKGIGSSLINFVLELAKSLELSLVELHVNSSNDTAVQFYSKFGFQVKATVENYYRYLNPKSAFLLAKVVSEKDEKEAICEK